MLPYVIRIIIFRHEAAFFDFSPSLKDSIYFIDDERLKTDRPSTPVERKNVETFSEAFQSNFLKALSSEKSIIVIDYNLNVALGLWLYTREIQKSKPFRYFFMSFFHDDEITSQIIADFADNTSSTEYCMGVKFEVIASMLDFPFIKKYEIPIFLEINDKYLASLITEQINSEQ
jgi:hypothetical protein